MAEVILKHLSKSFGTDVALDDVLRRLFEERLLQVASVEPIDLRRGHRHHLLDAVEPTTDSPLNVAIIDRSDRQLPSLIVELGKRPGSTSVQLQTNPVRLGDVDARARLRRRRLLRVPRDLASKELDPLLQHGIQVLAVHS